jgi:hypothetical protein
MHDHRDDRRRDHGHDHGHDDCGGRRRRGDRDDERGSGPDTRFLQLEMSEVLYAEAESVTKDALRQLLLEECKARFRERFGDQITGLAQLAVDELMQDIFASLEVEARIRHRNRDQDARRERLEGILKTGGEQSDRPDDDGPESGEDR